MSYPSSTQIEQIFSALGSNNEGFKSSLADHITVTITGNDHEYAGLVQGKEDLTEKHIKPILSLLDGENHPPKFTVVRVVGGGESAWAAVELSSTSKSKKGKLWKHDHAYFVHFNDSGKIDTLRGYYDSAHLNEHVADAK